MDANGAWSVDEARRPARGAREARIELAEQPVGTFEQMVELRRRVDVRIAADESLVSPFDARRARELGACRSPRSRSRRSGASRRPSRSPRSSRPTCRALSRDRSASPLRPTRCRRSGPHGDAGIAHGLATERLFSTSIGEGVAAIAIELIVGERPGSGVEIDEDALAARRLD